MRNWLVAMRKEAGLLQGEVSRQLDIAQPYYCEIERGTRQRDMTYSMMERLAAVFNVPVNNVIDAETDYKKLRGAGEAAGRGASAQAV
jgi:transcriptional regulator with XRE-family HTH domain